MGRYLSYQSGIVVELGPIPTHLTLAEHAVQRCNNMREAANVVDENLKVTGTLHYDSTINGYIYQDAK